MHVNQRGGKKEIPILLFVEKYLFTLITNCNEKVKRISHRNVIRMIGLKKKNNDSLGYEWPLYLI